MGSLAGAAYLLHDNAGVLRRAQWEQKSHVEQKGKSSLDSKISSANPNRESVAYRSFNFTSFKLEVSEKLPQGLTLQLLSVPGDVPQHRQVRQY